MSLSRRMRIAALLASLLLSFGSYAVEVAGVKVEEKVMAGSQELVLNGAGLRTKFVFKVYVGALYVVQKTTNPTAIVDSTSPRRMVLRMLRDMDAEALYNALDEGLRNNLTASELVDLKPRIEQLGAIMKGIGKVKEGDMIAIDFGAGGIEIGLNGKERGKLEGAAIAQALFKVWLGENPADGSLKKALLGG